jgi:hypothetical protein
MCKTRSWKSLEVSNSSELIIARRSDGANIRFFKVEFDSHDPIQDFVKRLEEFRNCQCTAEAPCNIHLEEKERIENANS